MVEHYSFRISSQDEDGHYLVKCPAFPGLSAFGETPEAALEEARWALEGMIEVYQEEGWPLPPPDAPATYSGQLRVRMPKSLHASLAQAAEDEGVSLNTLIITRLSRAR